MTQKLLNGKVSRYVTVSERTFPDRNKATEIAVYRLPLCVQSRDYLHLLPSCLETPDLLSCCYESCGF